MTTTPELLEAMRRADFKRASRASSSMHPSWLDDQWLAATTLASVLKSGNPFPKHWLEKHPELHHLLSLVEMLEPLTEEFPLVRMPPNTKYSIPDLWNPDKHQQWWDTRSAMLSMSSPGRSRQTDS